MIEINEHNFNDYFHDARKHDLKKGEVMASYRATAEFVSSQEKQDVINLLKVDKVDAVIQLMKKYHGATDYDAIHVLLEMCADLVSGMTDEEVVEKPYPMVVEFFFYTQKEYIPVEDPHWTCISIRDLTHQAEGDLVVSSRIVEPEIEAEEAVTST